GGCRRGGRGHRHRAHPRGRLAVLAGRSHEVPRAARGHAGLSRVSSLSFDTERRTQLLDITDGVRDAIEGATGSLVTLFVPHTTAGIVLQAAGEGASGVAPDVESALDRL